MSKATTVTVAASRAAPTVPPPGPALGRSARGGGVLEREQHGNGEQGDEGEQVDAEQGPAGGQHDRDADDVTDQRSGAAGEPARRRGLGEGQLAGTRVLGLPLLAAGSAGAGVERKRDRAAPQGAEHPDDLHRRHPLAVSAAVAVVREWAWSGASWRSPDWTRTNNPAMHR